MIDFTIMFSDKSIILFKNFYIFSMQHSIKRGILPLMKRLWFILFLFFLIFSPMAKEIDRAQFLPEALKNYAELRGETLLREEEAAAKGEPPKITKAVIARWGAGAFSYEEYATLEEHYNMLKKNNPNIDSNQEIFVKDLCMIHMMKMNAAKEKDVDTYNRTSEQYSRIFSKAGLKTIEEKDTSMNDSLGVTLSVISQYTPEEFYKDKQLYSDYDELGEYYDRHIRRPMQNLMTQTDVRDPEFNISDEDDNEETEG